MMDVKYIHRFVRVYTKAVQSLPDTPGLLPRFETWTVRMRGTVITDLQSIEPALQSDLLLEACSCAQDISDGKERAAMLKAGVCTALNHETLTRLRDSGIKSVVDFLVREPEQLSLELQIAYKDVCSIRRVLLTEHSAYTASASSLYQHALSSLAILSTGCESLDHLLDGGLYTGELTEIAGDSAAGKTQVCMRCAATTAKTDGLSVVYVDTSCAVSAECLLDVLAEGQTQAETSDKDLMSYLQDIHYVQVYDLFDLFAALDLLMTQLKTQRSHEGQSVKLVVVDSVTALVGSVMGGHARLTQGFLSQLGLKLKQLAVQFSLAVLVTNSLTTSYKGSRKKPALGKTWSHVAHTRLTMSRCSSPSSHDQGLRDVCLIKSTRQETPSEAVVSLKRGPGRPTV